MFLTLEKLNDHPDYPTWTVAEGRFKCFTELRNMLHGILSGENEPDDVAAKDAASGGNGLLKMLAMSLAYQHAISPDHPYSLKNTSLPARLQTKLGYIVPTKPSSGSMRGRNTPEVTNEDDTAPRINLLKPIEVLKRFDSASPPAIFTAAPDAENSMSVLTKEGKVAPSQKAAQSPVLKQNNSTPREESPKVSAIPVRAPLTLDIEPVQRASRGVMPVAAADTSDIPTQHGSRGGESNHARSSSAPPGARRPSAETDLPRAPISWVVGNEEGAAAAAVTAKPMPAALRRRMEAEKQANEEKRLQNEAAAAAAATAAVADEPSEKGKKGAKKKTPKKKKKDVPVEIKAPLERTRTASFLSNSSVKRLASNDSISIGGSFSSAESAVRRSGSAKISDLAKPNIGTTGEASPAKRSNYEIKRKRSILLTPAEGGSVVLVESPSAKSMEKFKGASDYFSTDGTSKNEDMFPCKKIDRVLSADALHQQEERSINLRLSKSYDGFSPAQQRDLSRNSPGLSPPGTPFSTTTNGSFMSDKAVAEYMPQVLYEEACPLRCVNLMNVSPMGEISLALGSNAKSVYSIIYSKMAADETVCAAGADNATTYNHNISQPGVNSDTSSRSSILQPVVRTDRELNNIHKGSVYTMDYHPQKRILVTGSNDKALRVSRPSTGEVSEAFRGHTGTIRVARFLMAENAAAGDGESAFIASGGAGDCMARLWDVQRGTGRELLRASSLLTQLCDPRLSMRLTIEYFFLSYFAGECIRAFKEKSDAPIHALVWLDKNIFMVGCEYGRIYGHDLRSSMPAWTYSLNDKIMNSRFADKQFVRRGINCLSLLNAATTTMQQSNSVRPVVAGCTEGYMTVFNVVNGDVYAHTRPHEDDVRSLSVLEIKQTRRQVESGEQKYRILTTSYDGTASLNTMRQNRNNLSFEHLSNPKIMRHADKVLSAVALPLGVSSHSVYPDIVTTSADGKATLWSASKTSTLF